MGDGRELQIDQITHGLLAGTSSGGFSQSVKFWMNDRMAVYAGVISPFSAIAAL